MGLHAGMIQCDVCGDNLTLKNLLGVDESTFTWFDFSTDGGATNKQLACCTNFKDAGHVETMIRLNQPRARPDGPLKTAIEKLLPA